MPDGSDPYCDVSLPVPLDQPFTYALPDTLRHRVRVGSRSKTPCALGAGPRIIVGVLSASCFMHSQGLRWCLGEPLIWRPGSCGTSQRDASVGGKRLFLFRDEKN